MAWAIQEQEQEGRNTEEYLRAAEVGPKKAVRRRSRRRLGPPRNGKNQETNIDRCARISTNPVGRRPPPLLRSSLSHLLLPNRLRPKLRFYLFFPPPVGPPPCGRGGGGGPPPRLGGTGWSPESFPEVAAVVNLPTLSMTSGTVGCGGGGGAELAIINNKGLVSRRPLLGLYIFFPKIVNQAALFTLYSCFLRR